MIEPIALFVMMKKKFGARAVGGLNEMRFGPSSSYILTSDVDGESHFKPPYVTRVLLRFRNLDKEDKYGRAQIDVIGVMDLNFSSNIEDLRAWIISTMLEVEMSR